MTAVQRLIRPTRPRRARHHTARRVLAEFEPRATTVERGQPRTQVGQADPRRCLRVEADAAVGDAHLEAPRLGARGDLDAPAVLARVDAVLHRVLQQRQQRHRREATCGQRRRHGDREAQPVGHAHVHRFEVGAHQCHLVAKRGRLVAQPRPSPGR
jgi:hypothetical protein